MVSIHGLVNIVWQKDNDALKTRLLEIIAQKSYQEGKVILVSGKESNYYIDGKLTSLDPEGGTIISVLFLRMLKENVSAVGGLTMGADPLASGVSQIGYLLGRNIDAFYVRKEPKAHGTSKWIEGPVIKGSSAAILEDVSTTGGSSIKAIYKAIEFGLKVEQVLAVVDRNEGSREALKKEGIEYNFIFDINEVIERTK